MTTGPDITAAVVVRTLKVTGGGNGNGHVTAPPTAGTEALDCAIVAATWNPIECTKTYPQHTVVVLTAVPDPGFTFKEWTGICTGTAPTCTVTMSIARSVKAHFKGPIVPRYQVNVGGGGDGGGTVTSQATLAPNIACTLDAGTGSGTCSRTYPSGTSLILTATPTSDHTFDGWSGDCTGTGTCNLSVTTNRSVTANFSGVLGPEATFGKWASSQPTPQIVGLHLNLLPGGNALMWGHGGEPQLLNMGGGGFTQVTNQTCTNPAACELFCSGHTFLADGRLLVAGGHNQALGDNNGLRQASTFNGSTWQATGSMAYERWYPTLVTLENGDVVALSGNRTPSQNASIPERYNGNTWTALTGANLALPLYPRAFVEPKNGRVFIAGEGTVRILDPGGSGSWSTGPARIVSARGYGSAVMLDSKVLYVGGGGSGCPGTPERSAEIIDLAAATPAWAATGSMAIGRRQTNLTILPDGKVLVTGGSSQCGFTNETGAVFTAEVWDPAAGVNGAWTTLASAGVVRVYHSTTALLPDGRVLSTGSGDGGGVIDQENYEIFSPPYLFKGPRPTYNLASTSMHYGQPFTVATPNAATIRKVTLIRLGSSTHAFDMGQRLNTLTFQAAADGQSLVLTSPSAGRIAPPGPYLLFILNDRGVPSVAQTVLLSQ